MTTPPIGGSSQKKPLEVVRRLSTFKIALFDQITFQHVQTHLIKFFVAFSAFCWLFCQGDMLRGDFPRITKLILHPLALFVNVDY